MSAIPNTAAAIGFLKALRPVGPHHLVAIREGERLEAKTFTSDRLLDAAAWIEARQGAANLYFHVNDLKETLLHQRASKSDVETARFLHVDIDDTDAAEHIRSFSPRPTMVVFSGGGFQCFWRLSEPVYQLDLVERCNLNIAQELGGDACHNIDRIMRLPGTINVPNNAKRNRGRIPILAYVVDDLTDWSRNYPIETFQQASLDSQELMTVGIGELPKHVDLASLPGTVSDELKRLITDGDDVDHPLGSKDPHFKSRSEAVFKVACELMRLGIEPEQVTSILLDPAYGISRSVLEKPRAQQYALRQVRSAAAAVAAGWPDADKTGRPRPTFRNTILAIHRLGISGQFDSFRRRKSIAGFLLQNFVGELSDDICLVLRKNVIDEFGFDPGRDNTIEAVSYVCLEETFHPIRDYLSALVWDRVPRVDRFLIDYLGAEDNELNRAISRIVLVAAVRRVREPGVKFDTILVLEGAQGSGKSTALQTLAGKEFFSDTEILMLDAKQQMEAMEGIWVFEIGELSGLNRAEIGKVKAFASRQIDRGRPAYGRFREDRARQVIFIGTTNDSKYLRDSTGNRRFWPVKTTAIDLERLGRDRDQLWAEAAAIELAGGPITLPSDLWAAAAAEQESRMEEHPWLDVLGRADGRLVNGMMRISTDELLGDVLGIMKGQQQPFQEKLVAELMRKLGWTASKWQVQGKHYRGYVKQPPDAGPPHTKQTF